MAFIDLQGECGITAVGSETDHVVREGGLDSQDAEITAISAQEYAANLGYITIEAA
jgi:hypothetical protein